MKPNNIDNLITSIFSIFHEIVMLLVIHFTLTTNAPFCQGETGAPVEQINIEAIVTQLKKYSIHFLVFVVVNSKSDYGTFQINYTVLFYS